MTSDTLDNLPPAVPSIEYLTVLPSGAVDMALNPGESPETEGIIIYSQVATGLQILDTTFVLNAYSDLLASANDSTACYTVAAMDSCGGVGLFEEDLHCTIYLQDSIDRCDAAVYLNWNIYQGWGGVDHQELIIENTTTGSLTTILDLDPAQTSYTVANLQDGEDYCFTIVGVHPTNSAWRSNSNRQCLTLNVVEPVQELFALNASVTTTGSTEITWLVNTSSDLMSYDVNLSSDNATFSNALTSAPSFPLVNQQLDDLVSAQPNVQKEFFEVVTSDSCGTQTTSNYCSSIFLSGIPLSGFINRLDWTDYDHPFGAVLSYEVVRIVNGVESSAGMFLPTEVEYLDQVNANNPLEANVCYYIIAFAEVQLPNGTSFIVESRSNTICLAQLPLIHVPNAFAPGGVNTEFRPLFVFGENATYQMRIFSRWGNEVFETTDPNTGWDGSVNGKPSPQGVYVFQISLVLSNGDRVERNGTLTLLR